MIVADADIRIREPVTEGVDIVFPCKGSNPVVILDRNGKFRLNCTGAESIVMKGKEGIPSGQFVNENRLEFTAAQWEALPKERRFLPGGNFLPAGGQDRTEPQYRGLPDEDGGSAVGGRQEKHSTGETVDLKASRKEYFKRFGYVRR